LVATTLVKVANRVLATTFPLFAQETLCDGCEFLIGYNDLTA
jgi:hypothetical protein